MNFTWLVEPFRAEGFEVYFVGGCVRDAIMGRVPKDWDIATNATPKQVMGLFEKVISTGEDFGGVTIIGPSGERIECTTYRADGQYKDGRRPEDIRFAKTIQEDLGRRDFTMNAIAQDPWTGEFVDPFGGVKDIKQKRVRAVGDAKERFKEDGLRILRAARFAAQLRGFWIDTDTKRAMRKSKATLVLVSAERTREEIMKAMAGDVPCRFWEVLSVSGLLKSVSPELAALRGLRQPKKYHAWDAYYHSLNVLYSMSSSSFDPLLRLVSAMHDIGKAKTQTLKEDGEPTFINHEDVGAVMIRELMMRLKFSNEDTDKAELLVKLHMVPYDGKWSDGTIRRWVGMAGSHWNDLMLLRKADLLGHGTDVSVRMGLLQELQERVTKLKEKGTHVVPKLAVSGHDVMSLTGAKGPEVGRVLKVLAEMVTDDPSKNTRDFLLEILTKV